MTDPILIPTTRSRAESLLEFLSKQWIGYGDRGVAVQQLCRDIEQALRHSLPGCEEVSPGVYVARESMTVFRKPKDAQFTQGSDPGDEHSTLTVREEQARGDDR